MGSFNQMSLFRCTGDRWLFLCNGCTSNHRNRDIFRSGLFLFHYSRSRLLYIFLNRHRNCTADLQSHHYHSNRGIFHQLNNLFLGKWDNILGRFLGSRDILSNLRCIQGKGLFRYSVDK